MNVDMSLLRHRPLRYVLVGGLNTGFSYGVYVLCIFVGWSVPIASLVSLVLGIVFSFRTQGKLVFGNGTARSFGRFVLAWALMYFVNVGIVLGLQRLGIDPYIGGAVATVVVAALSYFVLRDLVFAPRRQALPGSQ